MQNLWFYIKLGLDHVLDFSAYDHMLFLAALALPFTFKNWRKVVVLATVFTIAHCLSLALSTYDVLVMNVELVELLIPVTIIVTAIFNLFYINARAQDKSLLLHILATTFFGLIHGFGFSNYFRMLVAEEDDKLFPLLGFATGIEISQLLIVLSVLTLTHISLFILKIKQMRFVVISSILIILFTLPMLIRTFPL